MHHQKNIIKTVQHTNVNRHDHLPLAQVQRVKFHQILLGSINVRTAKDELRLAQHVIHSKHLGHSVTCVQESRITGQGESTYDDVVLKGWRIYWNGLKKKSQAGVAIFIAPHVKVFDVVHGLEGRISAVRCKIYGVRMTIVNCYAPTESYAASTKDMFYAELVKMVQTLAKSHPSFKLVVCGDFNASIGDDCDHGAYRSLGRVHDRVQTNYNGRKLIEFAENQGLFIMNTLLVIGPNTKAS